MTKFSITYKQKVQFNYMLSTLKQIANGSMTLDQIRRDAERAGLGCEEYIVKVHTRNQKVAARVVKGIKVLK